MKANDKEIEMLLRRHARRSKAASAAAGLAHSQPARAAAAAPHLDADELNAFAAGALSDAARARYGAHLADCDRCRLLGTQLTLAVRAAVERRRAVRPKPSWLARTRENLAHLFPPRAWRYVAPALALIVIAGATFVSLRHQRKAELMARNSPVSERQFGAEPSAQSAAPEVAQNREGAYAQPAERARASKEQAKPSTTGSAARETAADRTVASKPGATPEEQAKVPQNPPREYSPPPPEERAGEKEEESKKTATEPSAASKAEPSTAKEDERAGANKEAAEKDKTAQPTARAKVTENAKRRTGIAGGVMLPQSAGQTASASESSTESRRVSGHLFRRQGNAWVDTTFKSSMPVTNVSRGSDEFRALDAWLRSIAGQLGGEVIIVSKGKAYRIR